MRIASLISSGTEILFALGLDDVVVAVSHECDYPPEALTRPRVTFSNVDSQQSSDAIDTQVKSLSAAGSALYEIDREKLLQLRPDVIVTQAQCDVCAVRYEDVIDMVAQEPGLADTEVIALNPQSLGDVLQDVLRIGDALQVGERAREFIEELRGRIAYVQDRTSTLSAADRPRVVCIEWIEPLMLAANWLPELIDLAGGHCPLTIAGAHSTYSSWNEVRQFDPEVVVVAPCGFDLPRTVDESRVITCWPGFDQLSATKQGRVYAVDGNAYFNRSGPRLVETVEVLAHLFHPAEFSAPDWSASSPAWEQMT